MQLQDIFSLLALFAVAQGLPTGLSDDAARNSTITGEVDRPKILPRLGHNHGRDPANAIDMHIDCTNIPDICDADAYAMLCLGAPRVLQRDMNGSHKGAHYSRSGAKYQPFQDQNRDKYGTSIPHPNWVSPEEYPFEGANVEHEDNRLVFLFPVPGLQQSSQGGVLSRAYTQWHVDDGSWFHIVRFDNCNGPYCIGFNNEDNSVCRTKLKGGKMDWANFVWKRVSEARKALQYQFAGLPKTKRDLEAVDSVVRRDVGIAEGGTSIQNITSTYSTASTELIWANFDPDLVDPSIIGLEAPVVVEQAWDDGVW